MQTVPYLNSDGVDDGARDRALSYLAERSIPEPNSGCLLWIRAIDDAGYGVMLYRYSDQKFVRPHRLSLFLQVGAVLNGNMACHECDTPSCLNPCHLYVGNAKTNSNDTIARGRATHLRHDISIEGPANPNWKGGRWINRRKPGQVRGESCSYAKLNEEKVRHILSSSEYSRVLAERYGVSESTVRDVRKRKLWAHITAQPPVSAVRAEPEASPDDLLAEIGRRIAAQGV